MVVKLLLRNLLKSNIRIYGNKKRPEALTSGSFFI